MGYRLEPRESVPGAIKRIAREQIESSIDVLSQASPDGQDKAVHQARKHFKKLRALVRLVRDQVGNKAYRRENSCFREASHQLEALRDAQVRLNTFDHLLSHYGDSVEADEFISIRQLLLEDYAAVQGDDDQAATQVIPELKAAKRRVERWTIGDDWAALADGLTRIYAQGRLAFKTAQKTPNPENLHDWRKRVKDLWYHLCLLSPLWPATFKPWRAQVEQLSELLGQDHDLAMLRAHLRADPTRLGNADDARGVLLALSQRRQHELQTAASLLGQRLYAESPEAFANRMATYWRVWRLETQMAQLIAEPGDGVASEPLSPDAEPALN
ncbi:MAG: CHAD domain-containing protein [Elainellaceae cyanobacterium]